MATLEELLGQALTPPVIEDDPKKDAVLGAYSDPLFDTKATEQQRLKALQEGMVTGAIPSNAASLSQVNALQKQSDEFDTTWANSQTEIKAALDDVDYLLKDDKYKNISGEWQNLADSIFGELSGSARGVFTGGESLDAKRRLETLGGKVFLKNYEKLKGAGAISNVEGQTARAAYSMIFSSDGSVKADISEEGMKEALTTMKEVLGKAAKRLDNNLRWDEAAGKAIPAREWLEKYKNDPTATGELPTEEEVAKKASEPTYETITDTTKIDTLTEGTIFEYNGKRYKKGPGKTVFNVKQ